MCGGRGGINDEGALMESTQNKEYNHGDDATDRRRRTAEQSDKSAANTYFYNSRRTFTNFRLHATHTERTIDLIKECLFLCGLCAKKKHSGADETDDDNRSTRRGTVLWCYVYFMQKTRAVVVALALAREMICDG